MLNPQRKKKSRRKRRLEDVLGAEARYSPLEISEDGTFGAHDDAAPFWTKCKCILFGMTMVLMIPILVFVILDKCGFEISIHPKQESQPPPIITGVAQPKQLPSSGENSSNVKPPQEKPIDSKEETIEKSKSDKHTAKTVANEPSIHDKNKESSSRSSRPIPSLAKIDRLQCANDLNTNYDESFRYFHDPDASFCQVSKIVSIKCCSMHSKCDSSILLYTLTHFMCTPFFFIIYSQHVIVDRQLPRSLNRRKWFHPECGKPPLKRMSNWQSRHHPTWMW